MSDKMAKLRFIDLFAGIGGFRLGFERTCKAESVDFECVFSSEIKEHALGVYKDYFGNHTVHGDITKIHAKNIPEFDILLAGFPCQAFSSAGKRRGFLDTRGTLFFEIERILRAKRPYGFILENVEGLIGHDKVDKKKKIGRTLETILGILEDDLKYKVNYAVLNSKDFGLAQNRKRVFIVGTKDKKISLENFEEKDAVLEDFLETGLPTIKSEFVKSLLERYETQELYGKAIKDKRGGEENIHSWDIGLKGEVSGEQRRLLEELLKQRRKKHWAGRKGIKWMDGMPLTEEEIGTFFKSDNLKSLLDDLVDKGYLRYEHPKELVKRSLDNGDVIDVRDYHKGKEMGYNIVSGKLSFEITKILDPKGVTPTLVATDLSRIAVPDGDGLRRLSMREGLRLFGFPEGFSLEIDEKNGFDLLGNTVAVPIVEAISIRMVREAITRKRRPSQYDLNSFV